MSTFVPLHGTYLTVSIDPVATVQRFHDPDVTETARRMPTRKYIAYVNTIYDLPLPWNPSHKCAIQFVGRGLPTRFSYRSIRPEMSVPIAPATDHPASRDPLRTIPLFPLEDCYQYSFVNAIVRIPTEIIDARGAYKLPICEIMRHECYLREDNEHRQTLRTNGVPNSISVEAFDVPDPVLVSASEDESKIHGLSPVLDRLPVLSAWLLSSDRHGDYVSLSSSFASAYESDDTSVLTGADEDAGSDDDFVFAMDEILTNDSDEDRPYLVPFVNVSIDLPEADAVLDPNGFIEEQATLKKYVLQPSPGLARDRVHLGLSIWLECDNWPVS
ncbi:hypothetical protein B0H21DRAFT_692891 [Amylocystis lapponica]|nr:hypothetical protein B0H21DRAFT_692891 [Amylocystis lapponica]